MYNFSSINSALSLPSSLSVFPSFPFLLPSACKGTMNCFRPLGFLHASSSEEASVGAMDCLRAVFLSSNANQKVDGDVKVFKQRGLWLQRTYLGTVASCTLQHRPVSCVNSRFWRHIHAHSFPTILLDALAIAGLRRGVVERKDVNQHVTFSREKALSPSLLCLLKSRRFRCCSVGHTSLTFRTYSPTTIVLFSNSFASTSP